MTLQEHIDAVKATIKDRKKKMSDIMTKSAGAGGTPEGEDEATIQGLETEIKNLESNLGRLNMLQSSQAEWDESAVPVAGDTAQKGLDTNQGKPPVVTTESNIPKGIGFAMLVKSLAFAAHSKGAVTADTVLKSWNAPESVQKALTQKALIGTTTDPAFAASLVELNTMTGEFIELLRGKTAVDKIAPRMRQVPFNIKVPSQTGASTVGWVGEKKTKPVTNPTFGNMTLTKSKVAGIVLLSDELIRFSNPKADQLVLDDLLKSTATFIDGQFFDPSKAEAEDSPASVLHGVTAVTSTGTDGAAIEADLAKVIQGVLDAGLTLDGATWVTSETRAAQLSILRDALGKKYFEGMNLNGAKELLTLPVEISAACTDKIVLVLPGQILLADDDSMDFAISSEATINMGTDLAPEWVNLYQNNLMAIRAERFIRWKARGKAAGYVKFA
ncbi:phage major capsid protein [Acinetobacter chinensis]|uniref:Phage major capsid protein n=1 Tax=Acinetobacter chinensis TaxID=2004650 RepID=A0A3B7M0M5_9GAMM|nr:phage major capsid protein [Acinetobacter chinensis]AXY57277.1 phage major capsid protein [Acinetobacter chinensis]